MAEAKWSARLGARREQAVVHAGKVTDEMPRESRVQWEAQYLHPHPHFC